jgi:hypothetical protein
MRCDKEDNEEEFYPKKLPKSFEFQLYGVEGKIKGNKK